MNRTMYHTQENRGQTLTHPIICTRDDAWLGTAYYFWLYRHDAERWGVTSKNNHFVIYSAQIISENVLDTAFNVEHYEFFMNAIEQVALSIVEKTGRKPTKQMICEYLNNKADWKTRLDVIIVGDSPMGRNELLPIPLRRRIQAAVYNKECIHNFKPV